MAPAKTRLELAGTPRYIKGNVVQVDASTTAIIKGTTAVAIN